jgi:nucleoside-diphosphate-sugar epimerase
MNNVLVTGANGHLGYNLTRLLVARGYRVRAGVRHAHDPGKTRHLQALDVAIVEIELMQPETIAKAMIGIDGVFHVAAVFQSAANDIQKEVVEPNITGTMHVLQAARDAGVKKIVLTSSSVAVGIESPPNRPLTEADWNESIVDRYNYSKTVAEKRAWEFAKAHGLHLVCINPSAILGPGAYRHTPNTALLEMIILGKLPVVFPFGTCYVDVRDVAQAHLLAYEQPGAAGRYLVSNEQFISMLDLMRMAHQIDPAIKVARWVIPRPVLAGLSMLDWAAHTVLKAPRQLGPEAMEAAGKICVYSSAKARKELGWQPMAFRQCLSDSIEWIRQRRVCEQALSDGIIRA